MTSPDKTAKRPIALGFRHRVYLWVLALFLVFFNGTVLAVAWSSNDRAFTSQRDKLLTQQQYIVQALAEDTELIAQSRPLGLPLLYRRKADELLEENILLRVDTDAEIISTVPESFILQPAPATGQRIWYVADVTGHGRMLVAATAHDTGHPMTVTVCFPMQDFFDDWNDTLRSIAFLSLGCSLLLAIVLYLLLRLLTAPLARLETATRQLRSGNYTARVPVQGRDELGKLAESFNEMAHQLENHIARLQDAAEEKQRLLDALSHELRTPLAGISASVQYMQMARLNEQNYYETLEGMAFETHRMQNLADSMLNLSALRHGEKAPVEHCPLHAIAECAVTVLAPRTRQTGVTLQLTVEEELCIPGDPVLLESLLVNLLDNACKACALQAENAVATQEDYRPQVWLRLCRQQNWPAVLVTDNGAGMSAETLRRVGEPFFREDKARSRRWGGAGLGVSICRAIAQAHGAQLTYSSEKGHGTVACVLFCDKKEGDAQ